MPLWLSLAKGPLAYFALSIFVLGMLRHIVLTIWDLLAAKRRAGDQRKLPIGQAFKNTIAWLLPTSHFRRAKPAFVFASLFFHFGILISALFLGNHLEILASLIGFSWPSIFKPILDITALIGILGGLYIFFYRVYAADARAISRRMDYILVFLLLCLFTSGFVAGRDWNPIPYDSLMLFHTFCGFVIVIVAPFSKITHCVLFPLNRLATEVAWRLTPHGGKDVIKTLYDSEDKKI